VKAAQDIKFTTLNKATSLVALLAISIGKETSPITTTIRIQPCSKCGSFLQVFFGDKILSFITEKRRMVVES
jgi:hypothetical protein